MELNTTSTLSNKSNRKKPLFSNQAKLAAILLSPTGLIIALLIIFPMGYALYLSLNKVTIVAGEFVFELNKFRNYTYMLEDPRFISTLIQSIEFTVLRVGISVILGFSVALVLNESSMASKLLKYLFLIPWALSFVMNALMWSWMYNAD
ncbi:MAG: hypothetical protein MUO76_23485, partial [Anaerolineaceae bacterium]|nr:hypothetical protein [Anaerolineaceae bacterium]